METCNQDKFEYYFFILDWKLHREQTRIHLALDEGEGIGGLLLVNNGAIAQVRGNREAVEALLKFAPEKVELSAPMDCREVVLKRYHAAKLNEVMMVMALKRGEETPMVTTPPQRLRVEDAAAMADIMVRAMPSLWGDITPEALQRRLMILCCWE